MKPFEHSTGRSFSPSKSLATNLAAAALIVTLATSVANAQNERTKGTVTGALIGGGVGLVLGGGSAGVAGAVVGGVAGNLYGMEKKKRNRRGKYYKSKK